MPDINDIVVAVEAHVKTLELRGATAVAVQVRASGDDVDVIKVWADLGSSTVPATDWASDCETSIIKDVPGAAAFRIQVRVEKE